MMQRSLVRLSRMNASEIAWRTGTAARAVFDRVGFDMKPPRWSRQRLRRILSASPALRPVQAAVSAERWDDAHRELSRVFATAPRRFVIAPADRASIAARIAAVFPASAAHATARANRILNGEYDLLGYHGLRFEPPSSAATLSSSPTGDRTTAIDWSFDPVAGRRPPTGFWTAVPYLDPACGDHKVIWELNRHQHWLTLGRAYWLTGDCAYRRRFLDELDSWLAANPPLAGVNWASMLELAFRSISWVWAINLFVDPQQEDAHRTSSERPWLVDLLVALDRQLTQVERNLSRYFSPNTHLLGEALALYVCGRTLPVLAASTRREAVGRRVLLAEIERQIGADGGHAERSMHYHRYTLDFYILALVVARLTRDPECDRFGEAVERLGAAARLLADERGLLPLIGDDDGGSLFPIAGRAPDDVRDSLAIAAALTGRNDLQVGPAPEESVWIAGGTGATEPPAATRGASKSGAMPDTGYYVSRSSSEHLIIDGGPHGYQNGGHAHADALSLTMAAHGLPLLIDPGTACYTIDSALRDRMRSSAMHNTLTIDQRSQSLPRGPFHWAHVANTRVREWRANDAFDYFDGAHDGYAPVEHRRRVLVLHGDLVVVADQVSGEGTHTAAAHWHLDPRWMVRTEDRRITLTRAGERVQLVTPEGAVDFLSGDEDTGLGWYSPVYGSLARTTTIRIAHGGAAPFWLASVFGLDAQNGIEHVEWVPVWAEAGVTVHAAALRIVRTASVDHVVFAEPSAATPAADRDAANATWRVGDLETDARVLFCRQGADRPVARLAIVDGSLVRTIGRRAFHLALPRRAPDLHLDFTADARVAGPAMGARLVVGGCEQPLERDRRAGPRR